MKKIFTKISTFTLAFYLLVLNIGAAGSASISISATSIRVNQTATITVSIPDVANGMLEFTVSTTGVAKASATSFAEMSGRTSFTVTASSAGSGSVTLEGFGLGSDGSEYSISRTFNLTFTNPSSGGNTGTTKPPVTSPDKTPEQIAKEKEEAERLEREKLQKTPLLKKLTLISQSSKMYAETLALVEPEFDTFEYSFTLPKRIDNVLLNIEPVDDSVIVSYDSEMNYIENNITEYTFEILAKKGDIEQLFKYKVSLDTSEPVKISYDNLEYSVIDDEIFDKFLLENLNVSKDIFDSNGSSIPFYTLGSLKFQAIVNDEQKVLWALLDDQFNVSSLGTLVESKTGGVLFIKNAPETESLKTLRGVQYSNSTVILNQDLLKLDSSLTWVNDIKSWVLSDGTQIVFGIDSNGNEGTFLIDDQGLATYAVVLFDETTHNIYKPWAYISTTAAVAVLGLFLSYLFIQNRRKKQ